MGLTAALSIITRNGILKGDVFKLMLSSTLQVPYKALILIDDSDDDRTLNAVKSFTMENNKEIITLRSNTYGNPRATRATGRQTAFDTFLSSFTEDVLIQLDDDVVLMKGWWSAVEESFKDNRIGLYYGLTYDVNNLNELGNVNTNVQAVLINALERGRTNDFAIRRSTLHMIRNRFGIIPPELHLYEDAWIWRATQCTGYGIAIGFTGAFQHDPIKLSGSGDIRVDIRYLKLAAKYGIVQSTDAFTDAIKLLLPLTKLPSLIRKYGLIKTIRETYFRILYRYVKVRGSLTFSCDKLHGKTSSMPPMTLI